MDKNRTLHTTAPSKEECLAQMWEGLGIALADALKKGWNPEEETLPLAA